jgi:hypothetical protein
LITYSRSFLDLSLEEAQLLLGGNAKPVEGDEYGRMRNLTSLEDPQVFQGTLYLENNRVILVHVNSLGLGGYTKEDFQSYFSGTAILLRSRAGKKANLFVYANQGIAFSAQEDRLHFLEVFSPCSQKQYEAHVYKKPAAFIR